MAEENQKILLNKSRSKMSVNADTMFDIGIDSTEKKLPADKVGETINEYEQYIREKDGSNKYRLVFTINPICSNVLFNRITEIVKDEGSDGCCYFGVDGEIGSYNSFNTGYLKLKGINDGNTVKKSTLTRNYLIRDTSLSHPDLAKDYGLVYHCGYDIFNNHYFRNLETVLINEAVYEDVQAALSPSRPGRGIWPSNDIIIPTDSIMPLETLMPDSDKSLYIYSQSNITIEERPSEDINTQYKHTYYSEVNAGIECEIYLNKACGWQIMDDDDEYLTNVVDISKIKWDDATAWKINVKEVGITRLVATSSRSRNEKIEFIILSKLFVSPQNTILYVGGSSVLLKANVPCTWSLPDGYNRYVELTVSEDEKTANIRGIEAVSSFSLVVKSKNDTTQEEEIVVEVEQLQQGSEEFFIHPNPIKISIGGEEVVRATTASDGTGTNVNNVTWTIADENILQKIKVWERSGNITVRGKTKGETTITGVKDGVTKTITAYVGQGDEVPIPTSNPDLTIDQNILYLVEGDEGVKIRSNIKGTWASSDTDAVIIVGPYENVSEVTLKALMTGGANITINVSADTNHPNGQTASCFVNVSMGGSQNLIMEPQDVSIRVGQSITIMTSLSCDNWTISNENSLEEIVSLIVSDDRKQAKVTGKSSGVAYVIATCDDQEQRCKITVSENTEENGTQSEELRITYPSGDINMYEGEVKTFQSTIKGKWTSTNPNVVCFPKMPRGNQSVRDCDSILVQAKEYIDGGDNTSNIVIMDEKTGVYDRRTVTVLPNDNDEGEQSTTSSSNATALYFNELADDTRDYDGSKTGLIIGTASGTSSHIFFKETTRSFTESIDNALIERDGWIGFLNPGKIEISNFRYKTGKYESDFTINKCLNNNKACEFIDMYPDRSLYSFLPKYNRYRERNENNWDYCITYPYENYDDNELVTLFDRRGNKILNGLKAEFVDAFGTPITDVNEIFVDSSDDNTMEYKDHEYRNVTIRTNVRNSIKNGDNVILHITGTIVSGPVVYTVATPVNVRGTGLNGYDGDYYFSVNLSDISTTLDKFKISEIGETVFNLCCYVQRIADGSPCKYYFRKFKRLPNFKNTSVNNINTLNDETINKYCLNNFTSSLNKLGFSENIYGDRVAQIVFDDDIDTTNIFDNLGRPITELYLTIVKANRGNTKWYKDDNNGKMDSTSNNSETHFTDSTIEFSHCFSEVTSGIDMPWRKEDSDGKVTEFDYNVHGLHNLPQSDDATKDIVRNTVDLYPSSSVALEKKIDISGSTIVKEGTKRFNGEFLGDICELSENTLTEVVLDKVCHRFNTMQRENTTMPLEFGSIVYNEIIRDDYDKDGFKLSSDKFGGTEPEYLDNIAPEGYYYNPHYGIKLREFDDTVYEGYHTKVIFDKINDVTVRYDQVPITTVNGITDRNYYFEVGGNITLYDKESGLTFNGVITSVSGEEDEYRTIEFEITGYNIVVRVMNDYYTFFKPNILKPVNAYELKDGSGKYVWRVLKSCRDISSDSELYDSVFTNGCHYFHKNINFFLRRQDPYGYFWLNSIQNPNIPKEYGILDILGNGKDMTNVNYFKEGETNLC